MISILDPFRSTGKFRGTFTHRGKTADGRTLGQDAGLHPKHLVPDHHRTALWLGAENLSFSKVEHYIDVDYMFYLIDLFDWVYYSL